MRVGFVGWRGMVGSVLMERMRSERDFEAGFEPVFFTTSQVGGRAPDVGHDAGPLGDAHDLEALRTLDIIITCQGGDYTKAVHPALRRAGWQGYWIDAASTLRMHPDAVIILDPVNRPMIDAALHQGLKDYIGGNCTVSLMLMVMAGLFQQGWVEWVSSMTYQAASGAGARHMEELARQMIALSHAAAPVLDIPGMGALELAREVQDALRATDFPTTHFGVPLAASLIPWIDSPVGNGQSREEWKGHAEGNKILGLEPSVPIDGLCVRVGSMRCHSQALTIKLTRDVPLDELEAVIRETTPWTRVVPNTPEDSRRALTPAAVTGTLEVPIGRLHKMRMGPDFLTGFTVGDQLLWGAAEPLRRMLRILLEH